MIHDHSRGTCGERRIHAELSDLDVYIGRKRVARLMRALGLLKFTHPQRLLLLRSIER